MSARTDRWPAEAIEQLRELWALGHSAAVIGRMMGCSKNAIVGKSRRAGLDPRQSPIKNNIVPISPEQLAEIKERSAHGVGEQRIGDALGLSRTVVQRALGRDVPASCRPPIQRAPRVTLPVVVAAQRQPTPRPAIQPPPPRPVAVVLPLSGTSGPCCFPLGEPGTKAFRYCDDPSVRGKPYCADHVRLCYVAKPRAVEPKEFTFGWSSPG